MSFWIRSATLVLVAGLLNSAFGQTSTQMQRGYAIVTPQSGNSNGLIAVESLFSQSAGAQRQTDFSPSPLLTSAAFTVNIGGTTGGGTGLAIVNPTAFSGNVRLSITDAQGIQMLNQTLTILPNGQFARFVSELGGKVSTSTGSDGLLMLTSDVPLAVLAVNFHQAGITAAPVTSLSPVPLPVTNPGVVVPNVNIFPLLPGTGGQEALFFPQVVSGGNWSTEIRIANTNAMDQIVRIDFYDPNGVVLKSLTNIVIPARGMFMFSSKNGGI